MTVLTILTAIYFGVLVVALAASLIGIWVFLRRISAALADVAEALTAVREATAPLQVHLERLQQPCAGAAEELAQAEKMLTRAEEPAESVS